MRFEFDSSENRTVLRAVFEEGDRTEGQRAEGAGTTIVYSGDDIEFGYGVTAVHPDLLGLLCLIIFYPFVGDRVVFPVPVSPRLEEAFRNPNFKRQFSFDNVDSSIEAYSGSSMALAFGGGIDSSAVRTMFPEAYVVHEAHWREGRLVPAGTHRVVNDMGLDRGRVVATNQRYVSKPGGWHGWTCSLATALLLATDHDFGIILMGTPLGGHAPQGGNRVFRPVQGEGLARVHRELLAVRVQRGRDSGVLSRLRGQRLPDYGAIAGPDPVRRGVLLHRAGRACMPPMPEVLPQGHHPSGRRPRAPPAVGAL